MNLIEKAVEKCGIAWYNGFIRAVNLPDKTKFKEVIYGLYNQKYKRS